MFVELFEQFKQSKPIQIMNGENQITRGSIFTSLFTLGSDFAKNKLGLSPAPSAGSTVTAGQVQAREEVEVKDNKWMTYGLLALGAVLAIAVIWKVLK